MNFEELYEIVSIVGTVFQGVNREPEPQALFCTMRRR